MNGSLKKCVNVLTKELSEIARKLNEEEWLEMYESQHNKMKFLQTEGNLIYYLCGVGGTL